MQSLPQLESETHKINTLSPRDASKNIIITRSTQKRLICDLRDLMRNPLADQGIYYSHDDNNMLKGLALAGKGIIRVPEYLVDNEIKSGKLNAIFKEQMPSGSMIYMIHPQRIHQSKRISTFLEFTQQYFDNYKVDKS